MAGNTLTSGWSTKKQLLVAAILVACLVAAITISTLSLSPINPDSATQDSNSREPVNTTEQLQQLHADGVTGENVSIAILDPTGFDPDHPDLDGRVVATRSFSPGESIRNGGRNDHGTAAASLVARTAPEADLYLTAFDTPDGYQSALAWLVYQDVDVIVTPVEFYGKYGDGSSAVSRATSRAVREGAIVVAPAGNLGRGHWQGKFTPDANGSHQFEGGARNYLLGDDRRISLWLSWEDSPRKVSYNLELYRTNGTSSRLVASSRPFQGDETPNERLNVNVDPRGTYYFVVVGEPSADGTRIEISSPTHALQYRQRSRSIVAPATAENTIAVGAFDDSSGRVAPFSSAGPISEGRLGVDVVAPSRYAITDQPGDFVGSSAAAAHVGGVAALVLDANPGLAPSTVEALLRTTAIDVEQPGRDPLSGSGRVDPIPAVNQARNSTQNSI